jgi:LPS export ABC transporter protein LptC
MSRRGLEWTILAFGAVFLIVLAFAFRPGRRPSRGAAGRENLPAGSASEGAGEATTVLKGFDYTETLQGKTLFRIQAERTVGFGPAAGLVPNVYVLEHVTLTTYPEQGQPVIVRSDRAEYDQRSKAARLSGNVHWTDERGAIGETATLVFDPSQRLLTAPGPIHLTRGTFDLTSHSGRYDLKSRQVLLEGPVEGRGTGEGSGGLTSLSAEQAIYRRDEASIQLEGQVEATGNAGDRLACQTLVLKLAGEQGHIQWARAEGGVSGTLASSPVAPRAKGPPTLRRYAATSSAVQFSPQGQATSIALSGSPAQIWDARARVRAPTIEVALQNGRAVSAVARGRVHIESDKSRADSQEASLSFTPDGEVETTQLTGDVQMEGEGRSGRAAKAVEIAQRGVWILTGDRGSATVESGASRLSADRIEIDEKAKTLAAEGDARAVFTPSQTPADARSGQPAPLPIGEPGKPTFGKARRIVLDDGARVATLTGSATLWQGPSSLSGEAITLNDVERSAVAVGDTRTVALPQEGEKARPGKAGVPSPAVVTARRVTYREAASQAQFEGAVVFTRDSWQAKGDHATAFFGKDRKIERVEMSGGVTLADSGEGRTGRAEHATDWVREGKTVLEGSPASVADAAGNRVTGAVLTITDRGRRVEVTAPEGGKTETVHRTEKS